MSVPRGTVVTRVYYVVPGWASISRADGVEYKNRYAATVGALHAWAAIESELAISPPQVDERWVLEFPAGGGEDRLISREQVWPGFTSDVVGQEARAVAAAKALTEIRRQRRLAAAPQ